MDPGLIVIGLLLLLGLGKKGPKMVTVHAEAQRAPGSKHPITQTGGHDVKEWAQSRWKAAFDYLVNVKHVADVDAASIALSALAHWSIETGAGEQEYNFNLGGIHATTGSYFESTDTGEDGKAYKTDFASYDSLADGVEHYFAVLDEEFHECYELLLSAPKEAGWYKCLGEHGYYAKTFKGKDNIGPAAALWATKRANLAQYASTPTPG